MRARRRRPSGDPVRQGRCLAADGFGIRADPARPQSPAQWQLTIRGTLRPAAFSGHPGGSHGPGERRGRCQRVIGSHAGAAPFVAGWDLRVPIRHAPRESKPGLPSRWSSVREPVSRRRARAGRNRQAPVRHQRRGGSSATSKTARDRTISPTTANQMPGPLVRTAAGSLNWNAPAWASSTTRQPNPIQPTPARMANGDPAIQGRRAIAHGVGQGGQRGARGAHQEHADRRAGQAVARTRPGSPAFPRPATRAGGSQRSATARTVRPASFRGPRAGDAASPGAHP